MSEQTTQHVGRGYIGVSVDLHPHLGSPETPEQWHKALLLPDDWVIERVERLDEREVFQVFVQHKSIPPYGDDEPMPLVILGYQRHEDGSTTLVDMNVWHEDGGKWTKYEPCG